MKVWASFTLRVGFAAGLSLALCGCGRDATGSTDAHSGGDAQRSDIVIAGSRPGATPFISSVQLTGQSVSSVTSVTFAIAAMPNSVSSPANVTWNRSALQSRGYLKGNTINLPVFGLYANFQNQVTFQLAFDDGSVQELKDEIATEPYTDPTGSFTNPTIVKARAAGSTLGFKFFILKSDMSSPVIVDTDGQVRWVVPETAPTMSSYFSNGQFLLGSASSSAFSSLQMDGTQSALTAELPQPLLASFTHNIDPGPSGVLADFNGTDDLGGSTDDIVAEIAPFASQPPIQIFDMADILTAYMAKNGDDPTAFVRPGADWFHLNASTYDPSDDTVIVSSRENFLIKVNYSTHDVVWILGDPTKYWYSFPSLRAKALTLDAGGNYPIGQHGVSLTAEGYVMVLNDGLGSQNQPAGEPAGVTRSYSEVSTYSVNPTTMTAHEVWGFDYGQSIFSELCGSSYESPGGSYLVDFAFADEGSQARLVGLDSNQSVVFDFEYATPATCGVAWNAIPIPMENLQIH